jgi:hypothetical protein
MIKGYQWFTKNRVQVDEKIQLYVHSLKRAEEMIFPVILSPFMRRKKNPKGLTQ